MRYTITSPETEQRLASVEHELGTGAQCWTITLVGDGGKETKQVLNGASVAYQDGLLTVELAEPAGRRLVFPAARQSGDGVFIVATALGSLRLLAARGTSLDAAGGARGGQKAVKSSMPGKVLKILCAVGDQLQAGQPMMIIEAMKMENEIRSPQAGVVEEIGVQPGQSISTGDLLVKLGSGEKK